MTSEQSAGTTARAPWVGHTATAHGLSPDEVLLRISREDPPPALTLRELILRMADDAIVCRTADFAFCKACELAVDGSVMTTDDYSQDKHYCTDGEICDTCWMCPQCCPGLENCALVIEAEDDEVAS